MSCKKNAVPTKKKEALQLQEDPEASTVETVRTPGTKARRALSPGFRV